MSLSKLSARRFRCSCPRPQALFTYRGSFVGGIPVPHSGPGREDRPIVGRGEDGVAGVVQEVDALDRQLHLFMLT